MRKPERVKLKKIHLLLCNFRLWKISPRTSFQMTLCVKPIFHQRENKNPPFAQLYAPQLGGVVAGIGGALHCGVFVFCC